jgi:hypothetical protein
MIQLAIVPTGAPWRVGLGSHLDEDDAQYAGFRVRQRGIGFAN